jgi:hypothetical protein
VLDDRGLAPQVQPDPFVHVREHQVRLGILGQVAQAGHDPVAPQLRPGEGAVVDRHTNPGSPKRGDPDGMPSSSAVHRTIQDWAARNSRIRGVRTSIIWSS